MVDRVVLIVNVEDQFRGCKNLRLEQNENQDKIEIEEDEEEDVEEDDDEENDEDDGTIETKMVTDDIDELCLSYF